jgi:hypothetical protein
MLITIMTEKAAPRRSHLAVRWEERVVCSTFVSSVESQFNGLLSYFPWLGRKDALGVPKGVISLDSPSDFSFTESVFRSSDPVASSKPLPGLSLPGKDPGPHDTTAQFSRPEAPFHKRSLRGFL